MGEDAELLHHEPRPGYGRNRGGSDAIRGRNRGQSMAA